MKSAAREIYGLFVDNGSFAVALLAWTTAAICAPRFMPDSHWGGPIFFAGLALVLVENSLRSSRKR